MTLALLALAATAATWIHLGAVAIAGRLQGAVLAEVSLGFGGPVLRRDAPLVRVGVPLGGWVRFAEEPALAPRRRALAGLAGPVAVLAAATALLGTEALSAAAHAPVELLAGVLSPAQARADVLAALALPGTRLVGLTFAKVAAWNLLPLPSLAGGQALLALAPLPERVLTVLHVVAMLAMLVCFGAWTVAIVRALV